LLDTTLDFHEADLAINALLANDTSSDPERVGDMSHLFLLGRGALVDFA
jgi:hypothetical protein